MELPKVLTWELENGSNCVAASVADPHWFQCKLSLEIKATPADARGQTERANGRLKFPNHLRENTVEFNWPSYKIFTSGGPVPFNPKLSPF